MVRQVRGSSWRTARLQIRGRGHEVSRERREPSGAKCGIRKLAEADGDIHTFCYEVLIEIRYTQLQSQQRMALQELRQVRNDFASTEDNRKRDP